MAIPNLLVISDLHFHAWKSHATYDRGINSRLMHTVNAFRQALQIGADKGCRRLLVAGDVFHVRGKIRPSVFNVVADEFKRAVKLGYDVYIVPGNHDLETFSSDVSSVYALQYIEHMGRGVRVFDCPTKLRGGINITGIPYCNSLEEFTAKFEEANKEKNADIFLIHQGIDNFKTTSLMPDAGLTVGWFLERTKAWVFCGHYHNPNAVANVVSVGALNQHNFSEAGELRGCWTLCYGELEFHELDAPKFKVFTVTDGVTAWEEDYAGNIVKFRLEDMGREAKAIAEDLEKDALAKGAIDVVIEIVGGSEEVSERAIKVGKPVDMLSTYIDLYPRYGEHKAELMRMFAETCL